MASSNSGFKEIVENLLNFRQNPKIVIFLILQTSDPLIFILELGS